MSVTLTAEALGELDKFAPKIMATCKIIKNLFNADTRIEFDVSANVAAYGELEITSTLISRDWTIPNMTVILNDLDEKEGGVQGGLYNPLNNNSIWRQSPSKLPRECHVKLLVDILLPDGSKENMLTYYGIIKDARLKAGEQRQVEVITVMAQDERMNNEIGKLDGDSIWLAKGAY